MRFVIAVLLLPLALLWSAMVVALALALVSGAVAFGLGCRAAGALGAMCKAVVRRMTGARP